MNREARREIIRGGRGRSPESDLNFLAWAIVIVSLLANVVSKFLP